MAKKATMGENLYLQLIKGRLGQWKKEAIEGETKPIKNEAGETTGHAIYYESMEGKLSEIGIYEKEFRKGEFTEMLVIKLKGEGKGREILETEFKGSHATDFLIRLPNVDLAKSMELKAFTIKDEDKSKEKGKNVFTRSLVPYQPEKVAKFFTKENPNGMPDADVTVLKNKKGKGEEGAKTYDFSQREDFLRGLVMQYNEKLKALAATSKESETSVEAEA